MLFVWITILLRRIVQLCILNSSTFSILIYVLLKRRKLLLIYAHVYNAVYSMQIVEKARFYVQDNVVCRLGESIQGY